MTAITASMMLAGKITYKKPPKKQTKKTYRNILLQFVCECFLPWGLTLVQTQLLFIPFFLLMPRCLPQPSSVLPWKPAGVLLSHLTEEQNLIALKAALTHTAALKAYMGWETFWVDSSCLYFDRSMLRTFH